MSKINLDVLSENLVRGLARRTSRRGLLGGAWRYIGRSGGNAAFTCCARCQQRRGK